MTSQLAILVTSQIHNTAWHACIELCMAFLATTVPVKVKYTITLNRSTLYRAKLLKKLLKAVTYLRTFGLKPYYLLTASMIR